MGPRSLQAMAVGLGLPATAFLVDHHVHTWSPSWKTPPVDMFIGVVNPIGYGMTLLVVTMALWALAWCAARPRLHQAAWFASWTFLIAGSIEFALKPLGRRPRPK